jgi:aspartate kinase
MLVMKFGGSSVKDARAVDRVSTIVLGRLAGQPVVVVSALGGTTDTLVRILELIESGDGSAARDLAGAIRRHHEEVIDDVVTTPEQIRVARAAIDDGLNRLGRLIEGMDLLGEVSPRSRDAVLSLGELMAAPLLSCALRCRDLPAEPLDPREVVITDGRHGFASPDLAACCENCAKKIAPIVEAGRIPVLGGYVGATAGGVTTTLGRGGSDLTASLVARGLKASALEYWKDVDGILTADPGTVPGARPVTNLTFEEAAELAFLGARVLHPASIQPAVDAGVPVRVLNSYRPEARGTLITRKAGDGAAVSSDPRSAVVSIACKSHQLLVDVYSTRMLGASGFLRRVFEVFERLGLSVDHIATSEVNVSVTLAPTPRTAELTSLLGEVAQVRVREGVGVVSVVGHRIADTPGVAGAIFAALPDVNLHLITYGGSGVNLSFVMDTEHVPRVVRTLHASLIETRGD